MTNDEVYASGLLNRALDPATQPSEIQAFMRAEIDLTFPGRHCPCLPDILLFPRDACKTQISPPYEPSSGHLRLFDQQ